MEDKEMRNEVGWKPALVVINRKLFRFTLFSVVCFTDIDGISSCGNCILSNMIGWKYSLRLKFRELGTSHGFPVHVRYVVGNVFNRFSCVRCGALL